MNYENYDQAIEILRSGGLAAIPTETVYGLAANIFDRKAVSGIFTAKGRPSDNPLIVHISTMSMVSGLVTEITHKAQALADKFWPGPLTVVLPKTDKVNNTVSGGLNTVAIRMPKHKIALDIINKLGIPLAAPSANRSGGPSPTTAKHVYDDLYGRIDAIVDGGPCEFGVESTVISFTDNAAKILRPGAITREMIEEVIGNTEVDKAVYNKLKSGQTAASPGMKYKHYSPKCKVVIVDGRKEQYIEFVNKIGGGNVYAFCCDEDIPFLKIPYISYGGENNLLEQSKNLFDRLRYCDTINAGIVYVRCPKKAGIGFALYNRLLRSAGFEVINLER
ncbi:MAG: threonylcarbamoyl-AMP synthase [Oscillospiraceae bacterium]|nr:threonylcarbamoyl-AMP synthase [Oscillospiraceae bacterium]